MGTGQLIEVIGKGNLVVETKMGKREEGSSSDRCNVNDESLIPASETCELIENGSRLVPMQNNTGPQDYDHTPLKFKSLTKVYAKCNLCIVKPENFEEAAKDESWKKAMKAKIAMIEKNCTWELVDRPFDKPVVGVKSPSEATLYIKAFEAGILIVSLYIDDIIYTGSSSALMDEFKAKMMGKYEMSDLGLLHHFLGLEVIQTEGCIFLHQKKYARTLLEKLRLNDCKPVATALAANEKLSKIDGSEMADESLYKQMVGSFPYLTATRLDIMLAASLLARFMHNLTRKHMGTTKKVLRYIQGSLDYGIAYEKGKDVVLIGYCDSDWAGSEDDMKSTSGYAFSFGSGAFSWASIK
ncbi:uncharacterized mitochondrial protein AtMg00810-like [Pyrus communis]|uniref:uncharacterized mitochondrial protein AtMg00810-like n=1 Tax=Pyrus communis TaxID=23211 RepID=UPI0035C09840